MLYLAQVQKKSFLGKLELRLLAQQRAENAWVLLKEEEAITTTDTNVFHENVLVLVELSSTRQMVSIRDAKDWVLDILQKFLITGITPAFLQQETERAEQWRQSLTVQSQELDRRALELEARREQIQQLEEALKREKKLMEAMAAQVKTKFDSTN